MFKVKLATEKGYVFISESNDKLLNLKNDSVVLKIFNKCSTFY